MHKDELTGGARSAASVTPSFIADIDFVASSQSLVGGIDNWTVSVYTTPIPEPSTIILGASGVLGVMLARRRKMI